MKLTRVARTIIVEDSGTSLRRHVAKLEKDKDALQRAVDHGIEDYDRLVTGNKNLASECDELKSRCEGLQDELADARSTPRKELPLLRQKLGLLKLTALMLGLLARNV
jgi:formiminotetrahydrofolate cyclodeaminase